MDPLLEHFVAVAAYWNLMSLEDTTIGVADLEKFLAYYPGKTFTLGIQVGDVIKPGSITHRAITSGKREMGYVKKEVFGVPTIAIGIPILSNGKVAGCVATATTLDKQERLYLASEQLSVAMEQLSATAEQLTASSHQVESMTSEFQASANGLMADLTNLNHVTNLVNDVSARMHILGINSKIQAAHAGEAGRTFTVVATEIENLAGQTSSSTKEIGKMLDGIRCTMEKFNKQVHEISTAAGEQLAGIDALAQMATHLAEEAELLNQLAQYQTSDTVGKN